MMICNHQFRFCPFQTGQTERDMINNLSHFEQLLAEDSGAKPFFRVSGGYTFAEEHDLLRLQVIKRV